MPRLAASGQQANNMSFYILCDGLQAPELYTMAMAAAGALGVTEVPELWLQSSAQAAVHYLRMPLRRFHGLDGDLGFAVSAPHFSRKKLSWSCHCCLAGPQMDDNLHDLGGLRNEHASQSHILYCLRCWQPAAAPP